MAQQTYDPGGEWMFGEHGASILYLAGARNVISCTARQAEVVQPRQLPDGLLAVRLAGCDKKKYFLVEVTTYPEPRVVKQIRGGIRLVRPARGVLPEALVLCLCRRGLYWVPTQAEETSELGWTGETLRWKVVEMWTLPAEELLAAPNVGVVPWASLARYDGPPEVLLQRCRDGLELEGGELKANLLAVAQVFAQMHYGKPELLEILGGRKVMIKSPLVQGIVEESRLNDRARLCDKRFGLPGPWQARENGSSPSVTIHELCARRRQLPCPSLSRDFACPSRRRSSATYDFAAILA